MHKSITYGSAAAAVAVALSGLGVGGAGASATVGRAGQPAGNAAVAPGQAAAVSETQLWARHYNGPGGSYGGGDIDAASSVAVSPRGDKVFVTGRSAGKTSIGYATMAYNTANGARLWVKRYGPADVYGDPSLAVSPSGNRVFVTESGDSPKHGQGYVTVAYNAATGAKVWATRYTGYGSTWDAASSVAISPSGRTVFVTGSSHGRSSLDYATVAYNAATGTQVWVKHYNGPVKGDDYATSLAVSRGRVFVTGHSPAATSQDDYATVAYNAATGAQLWVKRYNGPPGYDDQASSVAVSPAGDRVFVTGSSIGRGTSFQYATVAYNAATGAQLWVKRYHHGPLVLANAASSVGVSPGGGTVFVTGSSPGSGDSVRDGYATLAYNAATGAQLWAARYDGPGNNADRASAVAVSPSRDRVYVTGTSYSAGSGYATVAYNAATGAQLWAARYDGRSSNGAEASSVAVSPTEDRVFVTGYTDSGNPGGRQLGYEYATVAYSG